MKRRKWLVLLVTLLLLVGLAAVALDQRVIVRHYSIHSEKVGTPVRLALLTDLHECDYGPAGQEILDILADGEVDVCLLAGDFFGDESDYTYAQAVLQVLAARYPCYYVTGNHEYWTGEIDQLLQIVADSGVTVLDMSSDLLTIGDTTLCISGIPDPYAMSYSGAPDPVAQLEQAAADIPPDTFTILMAHRPELIEQYAQYPFDLVVSGHTHGGQVRIPGLLNGLYAPNQGWFPAYAGGEYHVGNTTLIVSRGLGAGNILPRIFNRPEIVLIDLE